MAQLDTVCLLSLRADLRKAHLPRRKTVFRQLGLSPNDRQFVPMRSPSRRRRNRAQGKIGRVLLVSPSCGQCACRNDSVGRNELENRQSWPKRQPTRHIIGRTIVNHDPFKIAERLRAQTIECTMDRVRTIICWCKDCEKNLVHLMTIALMTAISFREKT